MKRVKICTMVICLLSITGATSYGAELTPKEIMTKNFSVNRVKDSKSETTMTLINENGQKRVRKSTGVSKLQKNGIDNMRLIRFNLPVDVKGTATLMIEHSDGDDDMWIYLPALKKVRRLVSSNKSDSFVGSDFSYGDIMGYKVHDFDHKLVASEAIDGADCYVMESTPINDNVKRDNGFSKKKSWIRKDNFVTAKEEKYDLSGQLFKVFKGADIKLIDKADNKWQAMTIETTNVQVNHKTIVSFGNMVVNTGIEDSYFSQRNLEKE